MKVKRIPRTHYCVICDDDLAEFEISNNGGLKLFWACGPTDKEITLCTRCFNELKKQINSIR